jgi:pimeloyl-ACP methyl ester carboxylesterase
VRNEYPLGPSIDGKRRQWRPTVPGSAASGQVCCYVAEKHRGRPLVLVHDLRLTSSAFEMRPLFEQFRWRRPTFALDFPGFGLSDRPAVAYSPSLYADVVEELLRKVRSRYASADVVALGRGAEPAARVARLERGLVHSLTVLEPAGLLPGTDEGRLVPIAARIAFAIGERAAHRFFEFLASRPMLRRAISARFYGDPDEGLFEYARASVHVSGAYRAPLATLASGRCEPEMTELYHGLVVPVLVVHDARGEQAVTLEAFLRGRANRFAVRVAPTRGMPQFERCSETVSALERFWQSLSGAAWDQAIR